jgi:hypothetical protein
MVKKDEDWLLKCPLCSKKLWFSNIDQHRRLKHLEISIEDFEALIISKITSGKLIPKLFENSKPSNSINSSTQAVRETTVRTASSRPLQGGRGSSK